MLYEVKCNTRKLYHEIVNVHPEWACGEIMTMRPCIIGLKSIEQTMNEWGDVQNVVSDLHRGLQTIPRSGT